QLVPDPWKEAGAIGLLADGDLDGKPDTLAFADLDHTVIFFDLDEDSFKNTAKLPTAAELSHSRAFDAEAAALQTHEQVMLWFDTDNDGRFDRLVVGKPVSDGSADAVYTIAATGELTRHDDEKGAPMVSAKMSDTQIEARLSRLSQ